MEPADDTRLDRAADRFGATPLELVGLAVLLTGALVASWALWWSATGRPNELPSAALEVGVGEATADVASPGGSSGQLGGPSAGEGHGASALAGGSGDDASGGLEDPGELTVHVTGAVVAPGLVVVVGGARVGEAVQAAGGLSGDADPELVNLARVLQDGEHVHIPRQGEDPVGDIAPAAGAASGGPDPVVGEGRIDLNRATADELQTLPGIGPARADAIVQFREANGPFAVPGDLRGVSGIGEATFQRLADLVVVG